MVCEPATSPPFPVAHNLQPATSSRASPKVFHLLSWPFSNASGPGMHMPTSFRARANARGLLASPCGQVVNLRARVKHWHFEGRMPEGLSPANASPLRLPPVSTARGWLWSSPLALPEGLLARGRLTIMGATVASLRIPAGILNPCGRRCLGKDRVRAALRGPGWRVAL